jgi:hypothetical protein
MLILLSGEYFMKKLNKLFSFVFIIFLVSCADSEMNETSETPEPNVGPFYAEFLACKAGPDFNQENVANMIAEFNQLNISDSIGWIGGYAPIEGQNQYAGINGWWEINWESKESAESAWKEWAANEEASEWSSNNASVVDCDTSQILGWNFYLPGEQVIEDWTSFTTATFECTFNEGKTSEDLKANIEEYNQWLADNSSDDPYQYGVYFPQYEAEQDFLWLNWHGDMNAMIAGNKNWEETGQAIQAGFDETSTCTTPDIYNSAQIYIAEQT